MSPELMVQQIASLRVDGADLIVRWKEKSPEAVETLTRLKPAVVLLDEAAREAECGEPLSVLLHEFQNDLELMVRGAFSAAVVAEAIRNIGQVRGWRIDRGNSFKTKRDVPLKDIA